MVDSSPKLYARAGGQWYGINLQASSSEGGVSDEFIMYVIVPAMVVVIGWSVSKLIEWRSNT